jgi:small subunit ribosomal protein S5
MADETENQGGAVAVEAAAPEAEGRGRGGRGRGGGDRGRGGRDGNRGRRDDRRNAEEAGEELIEKLVHINRVSKTVKGGKRFGFAALVVVGDRKGKVGVGVSKGADVQVAIAKATDVAKKHMIDIPVHKNTIPHEVEVKVSGARVLLKPASPGTGVIAGGVVRNVIGVTGITNLLSKSLGSSNKVNVAYATIEALRSLVPKEEWQHGAKAPKTVKASIDAAKKTEKGDK